MSYIYTTFRSEQKGIAVIAQELTQLMIIDNAFFLTMLLLLVPVNWMLESLKWQLLARKAIPITFWEALRSTLTGLAVGVALPAQLGDTLGRVGSLSSVHRLKTIGAAMVSNGVQFYVSLLAGSICWLTMKNKLSVPEWIYTTTAVFLFFGIFLGGLIAYFRFDLLRWKTNNTLYLRILPYFEVIGRYTPSDLFTALSLGLLRYLVFLFQFTLALSLFDLGIDLTELLSGVGIILLAKTVIPALNLFGDLGLREFTALYVFKNYAVPSEKIVAATLLIWFINILGPLLVGIVLVWRYKWRN